MTSTVQKSVAIKINQNKLLAKLEYSFTNKSTLLGEMIQNARRAGATAVNVTFDEASGLLTFADDGAGIADFQDLLSIAESGWDESIQASERPFGMGFMSTLYSAEHVRVESNGYFIEGNTKELLAGGTLTVEKAANAPASTYTEVVLSGVGLEAVHVKDKLEKLARGFAIPVWLNGEVLKQDRHLGGDLNFIEVPGVGYVYCSEFDLANGESEFGSVHASKTIYLQGAPMFDNATRFCKLFSVVHLDPTLYFGRIPDRDILVNADEVMTKVNNVINQIHLDRLKKLKSELSPEDFAKRSITRYALNTEGGFDLLCEKDVMLSGYFAGEVNETQPSMYRDHDLTSYSRVKPASYKQVESGEVVYFDAGQTNSDEVGLNAAWLFARRAGYIFVGKNNSVEFDKHWVKPFVQFLDEESVSVTVHRVEKEVELALDNWFCNMVLCDYYTLTYTNQVTGVKTELKIDDEPLYTEDGKFLVPANVTWISQDSLMQADGYYSDDDLDEVKLCEDESEINTFLKFQRSGDINQTLQSILNAVNLNDYPVAAGKKYTLTIDDDLKMKLEEVIA